MNKRGYNEGLSIPIVATIIIEKSLIVEDNKISKKKQVDHIQKKKNCQLQYRI